MSKVILSNIKMPVRHSDVEALEQAVRFAKRRGVEVSNPVIYKKSLDARRKSDIHFVYSIVANAENPKKGMLSEDIRIFSEEKSIDFDRFLRDSSVKNDRILIVGSGPCGLFAAYVLTKCGAKVTLIERGSDVDSRVKKIESFWKNGVLDPNTNIQFGEGGAGTFSDGKLNTRIGDPLQRFVLSVFVECGAPKDIMYQAKPHIGTDFLRLCVTNLRKKIIENGGEVLFDTCLTGIKIKDGRVCGAEINNSDSIDCNKLILALGHSSRDTYEMLERIGIVMEQKPFAAGIRIEHRREYINRIQYGDSADFEQLPTADYRLAYNGDERSCYSFCMCPGGIVVNASSEAEGLVVNGMSYHGRMEDNSNSALVVTVRPEDFASSSPLAGVEFQRKYEHLAYTAGCGKAPVQLAMDFMAGRVSDGFNGVVPSFTGETCFVDLRECLPEFIWKTLREGLVFFDKKMKGFSSEGSVMTGVEMRTSAPLRIKRDEGYECIGISGLYPAGEGAGYAGGIMSAAIDGIKVAERILSK